MLEETMLQVHCVRERLCERERECVAVGHVLEETVLQVHCVGERVCECVCA